MPTINIAAQLTPGNLLDAVGQLNPEELETFVSEVLALRNRRLSPSLDKTESELFEIINQGMPEETQHRFAQLKARLQADAMTPEEQAEFLQITDQREKQNVRRVEALVALAQHRGVTVHQLMEQLGIKTAAYE
jgi:predicted DNA-binding transcriptional regulator YafY